MSLARFEETLLRSGAGDAPSPERRAAARAAALRAAGVTTLAESATISSSTSTAGAAPATKVLSIGKLALMLGLGAGMVAAAAVTSATWTRRGSATPPPVIAAPAKVMSATETPSHVVAAPSAPPAEVMSATETPIPTLHVSEIPAVTSAPARSSERARRTEDEVGVEARALEAARRCLADGDVACARTRLAEYDARFAQRGVLADEATLLAIEVALADGRRDQARALARDLTERRPRGTWSARVKKLAEEAE